MKKLNIIYEDKELLVINKESKLLTIGTSKNKLNTLYHEVREYIRKKNQKVFIVNRLDKDTSGIVLFAKNENVKKYLQQNWNNTKRFYRAVVHGCVKDKDTLKFKLSISKTLFTYVSKDGEDSITKYQRISQNGNYSYVDIEILTGKKNQIRVAFSHIGNPLVGDRKYGVKDDCNHLLLHAYLLSVNIKGKVLTFKCDVPTYFKKYTM